MTTNSAFEIFSALLVAAIILYQLLSLGKSGLKGKPGARLILFGFIFIFFGACLDVTDEYPQLNHLVIVGDTEVEAFLEKFFGYLLGYLLLFLGISRMLPVFKALNEKQSLIETILETIPAPTFCKDREGRYLLCNSAFEDFIGYPREKIIGQTVFALAPREFAEIYHRADLELLEKKGRQTYEAQVAGDEGSSRDVLFHKAVFCKEDGSSQGLVGVMLDVTEQTRVQQGLRHLDKMKSEFISIAAHELRTPLTSVQGYAELLLEPDQAKHFSVEQKQDFLREIYQASEVLGALVDDLLNIGRIESGLPLPVTVKLQPFEPMLQKVIAAFRLRNRNRQIDLVTHFAPQMEVPFDSHRIRQVIENLLSNAVKYSPEESSIEIEACLRENFLQLEVRDQGIGMTAEQLAQVFDRFYRADKDQKQTSGLGIGMSIVKNIVDAHQGLIEIESQFGVGTCVRVSIPQVV